MGVEADYALGQLYDQLINAVNPTDSASISGSLAAIVKYIAAGSVVGYQATASQVPARTQLPNLVEIPSIANRIQSQVGTVWPAANRAIYLPFTIDQTRTITNIYVHIITSSGNIDGGIYNAAGAKQVSLGSTAMAASNSVQTLNVADTALTAGRYFLAIAVDNTTAVLSGFSMEQGLITNPQNLLDLLGIKQEASAFALPSTATFASPTSSFMPSVAIAWS